MFANVWCVIFRNYCDELAQCTRPKDPQCEKCICLFLCAINPAKLSPTEMSTQWFVGRRSDRFCCECLLSVLGVLGEKIVLN
jgi:hypothetical protein